MQSRALQTQRGMAASTPTALLGDTGTAPAGKASVGTWASGDQWTPPAERPPLAPASSRAFQGANLPRRAAFGGTERRFESRHVKELRR